MRVGAIPFTRGTDGLMVCMVSTSASRKRFTFPKGVLKRREPWKKGALRELREEAGVVGRILLSRTPLVLAGKRPADSIVLYWCEIESIDEDWKEDGLRKRKFFPVDRMPKAKLGGVGRKVFAEILDLNLNPGGGEPVRPLRSGIAGRIRARLTGLVARRNLDAAES